MSRAFSLARAGNWFLRSGIQSENGGVARFYRADLRQNRAISTEITGYTASALVYLFRATGDSVYLDRAAHTARFLCDTAWDSPGGIFPFEYPSPSAVSEHLAYFFDSGIVIRGLIQVWRQTKAERLIAVATAAAHGMIRDFRAAGGEYHPVLRLPSKQPVDRAHHWSQSAACYQTKSALSWWELAQITGDEELRTAYLESIDSALRSYLEFLPGTQIRTGIMDRLHAGSYFLEALEPLLAKQECSAAYSFTLNKISSYLRDIAPEFVRSDVYAQLLRARLFGEPFIVLDEEAAAEEASALAEFQTGSADARIDGGFYFGRRDGVMVPHMNPVSTAFALQALDLWNARQAGETDPCRMPPI